jgi:hypothetical protein
VKTAFIYLGLAIVLAIFGFLNTENFMEFSISQLNKGETIITTKNPMTAFELNVKFAFSIGLLPILMFVSDKFAKFKSISQYLISLGTILSFGILGWQFKIYQLNQQLKLISDIRLDGDSAGIMLLENLNFGTYIIYGFITGTALIMLIFRYKNRQLKQSKTITQ